MAEAFTRSSRRLSRPSAGRSLWLPLGLAGLVAAWLCWSLLARVTVYAVSDSARIEVEQAACPVEALVAGHVTATHVVLGAEVRAGDPLVVLDSARLELQRGELLATRASREAELGPLADRVRALESQLDDQGHAAATGNEEQNAGIQEAEAALLLATSVVERSTKLGAEGLMSEAELVRVQSERDRHRAGLSRQRAARDRSDWDRRAQTSELRADLAESRHRLVQVRGECAVTDAAIARLDHDIERHTIRAPVAGRLGETANLRPGQFVAQGLRLAAIVPGGGLRIVAAFRPQDALGRVRIGQTARLRLHGFPWTQYGFVSARVCGLASEALSGAVRVEASVAGDPAFPVTLQHGWPGTLEIEVERVAPATLVLRAAGASLESTSRATDVVGAAGGR